MAKTTTRQSTAKKWTLLALIMFLLVVVVASTYTRYESTGVEKCKQQNGQLQLQLMMEQH